MHEILPTEKKLTSKSRYAELKDVRFILTQEVLDEFGAVSWSSFAYVLPFVDDGLVNLSFVGNIRTVLR